MLRAIREFELQAKAVVNAAGVFAEDVLAMDGEERGSLLAMSQGTHFVLSHSLLPSGSALDDSKDCGWTGVVCYSVAWSNGRGNDR